MDYLDPENSLQLLYSKNVPPGPNSSSFKNKKFDQLFDEISTMRESSAKKIKLQKMEEIIFQEVPWLMSHYERYYILHHQKIKNFRFSDSIPNFYKYLRLDPKHANK